MSDTPRQPIPMPDSTHVKRMLDRAARAAMRAVGDAEPNPLVGCVLERGGAVIGIGHHKVFGGLHAEREALGDCRRRGIDPRGATMYCTLEPCCHHGKQPPCTEAVIEAGLARVIFARPDPADVSRGGGAILRNAGIDARCVDCSPLATYLSDPFVHHVRSGLPWVIAKWAQTIDGRIATRTGASQWISGALMRRRVHRLRARVDAVVVGRGTVLADDPRLTPRDIRRVRRQPARVILDSEGKTPHEATLIATSDVTPTVVITANPDASFPPGVRRITVGRAGAGVDLLAAMRALHEEMGVATVLVEAGPRVLGSMIEAGLIDEAFVHIAPMVLGDAEALPAATGRVAPSLTDAGRFGLVRAKALGGDIELHYRRSLEP